MFGRSKKRIAAMALAEGLVETAESRGPHHYVATTDRGGVAVTVEIRPQQLYREGEPVDRSPQRVFRRHGLPADLQLLVRPPRGHITRPEVPRWPLVPTGDAAFDARFEVFATDEAQVSAVLTPPLRSRLLAFGDFAELRIEDGAASLHLTFSKLDHEPIRQGIETVLALA
ncbi:MAG: hypothetical protein KDB21_05885 [Acidimicrobiales bacterium]|nr:hypothetical protein [Acidimicrobiales bacterium]